jgi:hypothetical protein
MLRVAREAVILVEPQDTVIDTLPDRNNPYWYEISGNDMLVGRRGETTPIQKYPTDWREDVGNYVYTISRREMKKLAIGMQLPLLAFKNFNDHYDPRLS